MDTIKLRQKFINYFRSQGHTYLPQSNIYIEEDKSLLFVNAGMNQLKDIFIGRNKIPDTSLANSQICVRAGGKHNDLDDVGKDSYHLSLFEMCGNWSINKYGKEQAIFYAFDFLVNICKLDVNRMYVTYLEEPEDNESKQIWLKYISEDRICKGSRKDNFWSMGTSGPCGPCTEIHYDLIGTENRSHLVNKDDPTLIEIWNVVFMTYVCENDVYTKSECDKNVDTGFGLERLSMVLQNKKSIYDIDVFQSIISYAQIITGAERYIDNYDKINIGYRIFADHIRTVVVGLFQGIQFGPTGRNFVLRKIFRRLLSFSYVYLKKSCEPIMNQNITKCLISHILDFFLFKKHDVDSIYNMIISEELAFCNMISTTKQKYNRYMKKYNDSVVVTKKLKEERGIDDEILHFIIEESIF